MGQHNGRLVFGRKQHLLTYRRADRACRPAIFLILIGIVLGHAVRPAGKLAHSSHTEGRVLLIGWCGAMAVALTTGILDHHFANIRFTPMLALWWTLVGLVVASSLILNRLGTGQDLPINDPSTT